MIVPRFDSSGSDGTTFAPFELIDQRNSEWKDVRLSFNAWDWLHNFCGGESFDGYYLNGYGVEGLVKASRLHAGLEPEAEGIDYDSEGDTCFIHFSELTDAVETARLAADMFKDRSRLSAMIQIARKHGFED